jgi:hypothetical protein
MVGFTVLLVRFLPLIFVMLTRREILTQLKTAGVSEWFLLKRHCRDFENYMALRYGLTIARRAGEGINLPVRG